MKKFYILMLFSLLVVSPAYGAVCKEHPAIKILKIFNPETENKTEVNPYMVNIRAMYLLNKGTHTKEIKDYILWYFDHTNYPDKHGLTGTVYDYFVTCKGEEISTKKYDSVDAYAGNFLYLIYKYYAKTKDKEIIQRNQEKIEDIAYLIEFLQDEDGLTKVMPGDNTKYLMDNCEAFAGVKAFNALSREMGWGIKPDYVELENSLKNAIINSLYSKDKKIFYWGIAEKKAYPSSWNKFYPDAFAQIFPILFDVLDKDPQIEKELWKEFSDKYENKPNVFSIEQKLMFELASDKRNRK
jgi:hypothetical protein